MHLLANLLEKLEQQPTAPSKNSKSYVTNWLDWMKLTEESRNIDHLLKRKGDLVFYRPTPTGFELNSKTLTTC